jgi:glycosyltransferase involved in cell wall biosynthesis
MSRYLDRALYASELHDLYALADAVFYFSKSENFGLPIIESALVKTPVFTSKLKVFREIAENKLIEIDLAKNSAEQTARIIADHMENDNLIKINRLVRQRYNQEEIIKRQLVPLL